MNGKCKRKNHTYQQSMEEEYRYSCRKYGIRREKCDHLHHVCKMNETKFKFVSKTILIINLHSTIINAFIFDIEIYTIYELATQIYQFWWLNFEISTFL